MKKVNEIAVSNGKKTKVPYIDLYRTHFRIFVCLKDPKCSKMGYDAEKIRDAYKYERKELLAFKPEWVGPNEMEFFKYTFYEALTLAEQIYNILKKYVNLIEPGKSTNYLATRISIFPPPQSYGMWYKDSNFEFTLKDWRKYLSVNELSDRILKHMQELQNNFDNTHQCIVGLLEVIVKKQLKKK